jgi:hypothetical protein
LDSQGQAVRLSLDLRGRRPSLDELALVAQDPEELTGLVDGWIREPAFATRMAWLWNDSFHTAVWGQSYERFGPLAPETWQAMGWEPLAILAAIVDEDRPFTDLVLVRETRATPALAELYGLSYGGDGDWEWASYTDDRPAAGVVSANGLWLRYTADALNLNRQRANALSKLLLCADFLDREGGFEFDLSPEDLTAMDDAVKTQETCVNCHAALDPLAAFFGGFAEKSDELPDENYVQWSPFGAAMAGTASWFGTPANGLEDLGQLIAVDPRFASCAVERFYQGLVGEPPQPDRHRELTQAWVAGDQTARDLVRAIVSLPEYLADERRLVTLEQLHTTLEDLLQVTPAVTPDEGLGPMAWDADMRVLAGAPDDVTRLVRATVPTLGLHAVLAWAARSTIPEGLEDVLEVDSEDSDPEVVRDELARLHHRFFGVAGTDGDLDSLQTLHAAGGWELVLAGLIRHPRMLVY